jgi:uncharacterized repeat protein (TIGR01451 family)
MRRVAFLVVLATLVTAAPAAAHPLPAACTSNSTDLTVVRDRVVARPGDTITYGVTASNLGASACDVTDATVKLFLPGPDGQPAAPPVTLITEGSLPAGTGPVGVGEPQAYTVAVDPGVDSIVARVEATGVLHDAPIDHIASIIKTIGTVSTQPRLGFTFGASPLTGFAPFTTTYEFRVTNSSTTDVPMAPPTIQHTSCPAVYASGDAAPVGQLDTNETWRYTCTRLFPAPLNFSSTATAAAQSTVDGQPVLGPPSGLVSVTAATPPAATLALSRTADPPGGPAPLTVNHTYTLRNTSGADPRPVANVTVTDALCAPVVPAAGNDALLNAGESWTFTCTQTLATPRTVNGTAVANGTDDLGFGVTSSSNQAAIEITATAANPGPTPTATPTPTTTPTPTPTTTLPPPSTTPTPQPSVTPTSSARVSFAAISGRLARPCGKTATAQLKVGKRLVASKRIRLDRRCRYTVRFTNVARSRLKGATRVTVSVRAGKRTKTHRLAVPKR